MKDMNCVKTPTVETLKNIMLNLFQENYPMLSNIHNSLNLQKSLTQKDFETKSLKLDKNIQFNEYDGTKVYSRSAPNNNCSSVIFENYICNQFNSNNKIDDGYKIIGLSDKTFL